MASSTKPGRLRFIPITQHVQEVALTMLLRRRRAANLDTGTGLATLWYGDEREQQSEV